MSNLLYQPLDVYRHFPPYLNIFFFGSFAFGWFSCTLTNTIERLHPSIRLLIGFVFILWKLLARRVLIPIWSINYSFVVVFVGIRKMQIRHIDKFVLKSILLLKASSFKFQYKFNQMDYLYKFRGIYYLYLQPIVLLYCVPFVELGSIENTVKVSIFFCCTMTFIFLNSKNAVQFI